MGICEALCDILACKKGYTNTFDLISKYKRDLHKHVPLKQRLGFEPGTFGCAGLPKPNPPTSV